MNEKYFLFNLIKYFKKINEINFAQVFLKFNLKKYWIKFFK